MEDKICQFWKYKYCKFKSECKRKHLSEDCKDLQNCKNMKSCEEDTLRGAKSVTLKNVDLKKPATTKTWS